MLGKAIGTAWVGPQVGGLGSLGIIRAGGTVWVRLMETQIWSLPAPAVGGLNKGTMGSARTSVLRKLPIQPLP